MSWRATSLASLAVAALLSTPAVASADGPWTPHLVARGTSLYGVPWRIKAGEERSYQQGPIRLATISFEIGFPGEYSEAGYSSGFPLPIPSTFVLHFNSGSDVDDYPEADTSGMANRRAARLVATMSDGTEATIPTVRAPERLSNRLHWLRRLQFFDFFYPDGVEPVAIAAYGRDGHLIGREPA